MKERKSRSGKEGAELKKPRRKPYKSPIKKRRDRCDKLFAQYVKERDQTCQNPQCKGRSEVLDWSHFISRSRISVRWDKDNCYALCRTCHFYFDGNALGKLCYDELVRQRLGEDSYFALKEKARQVIKEREAVEICESFLISKGYKI